MSPNSSRSLPPVSRRRLLQSALMLPAIFLGMSRWTKFTGFRGIYQPSARQVKWFNVGREDPLSFSSPTIPQQASEVLKRAPKGKYLLLGGDPADQNAFMLREGQMKVLKPAIESGDIQIVADPFCDKWLRAEAARYAEDALTKHPDLAAIVASNDGTAGGAIAALQARGLAGKVAVSGQDADLEACRNVAKGLQTVTVYKPIKKIAELSAHIAVMMAWGNDLSTIDMILSGGESWDAQMKGFRDAEVGKTATAFIAPIPVTKENLDQTVIADGFHSDEEVYAE